MADINRETAGHRPRRRDARGWTLAGAALALGLGAVLGLAACDRVQRFPVCQSSADCAERDGGAQASVCFNLKCVECRYDTDCDPGKACSSAHRCEGLDARSPDKANAGPVRWDPGSWNECAASCKDPACLKKCNEKFDQEGQ